MIAQNSNTRTPGERSVEGSEQSRRSVPVNTVHLETKREESTSVQPKITEPLCTAGEVQTGGSGHGSDTSPTWRLHDETRFTGCILHGAYTRETQEVPKTAISEQNARIPVSPLRSFICPESFQKIAEACGSSVRASGIRIVIYLDDILIMHQDRQEIVRIFNMVLALLENLEFLIKREKCPLYPNQALVFLGALLDSRKMTIAVPMEKVQNLQIESAKALRNRSCSMHQSAAMIGRINQMSRIGIQQAPLHYRALQRAYIRCLHP